MAQTITEDTLSDVPSRVSFKEMRATFGQTVQYARLAPTTTFVYIFLAIVSTLTEVISVSLLVPLLGALNASSSIFSETPVLMWIASLFEFFPEGQKLQWIAGIMLVLIVCRGLLGLFSEVYSYSIPIDVERRLRLEATQRLLHAKVEYVDNIPIEKIASYCVEFPARIGIAIRFAAMFTVAVIISLVYIGGLFVMSPVMALVTLVTITVFALLYRAITHKRVHKIAKSVTKTREAFNQNFYETVQSTIEIRLSRSRERAMGTIKNVIDQLMKVHKRNFILELSSYPFVSSIAGLAVCAIVFFIGMQPVDVQPSLIAPLFIFLALFSRIVSPLTIINICRHHYSLHSTVYEEFETFMRDTRRNRDVDGRRDVSGFGDDISMKDIDFAYGDDSPVLRDINVSIKKNQFIGLVGPSGSGKSTFAILLTRLYRPQKGQILVDGIDLNDLNSDGWLSRIGYARQQAFVASRSIADIISSGDEEAGARDRIQAAAKAAMADDFITELPEGYETVLTNQANDLSTGQRQRLVLARALYANPEILIIDEGVSGLDAITERAVMQNIETMQGQRTIILITHNLSHIRTADQIIVMQNGQIVQTGDYAGLEQQEGLFRKMLYG